MTELNVIREFLMAAHSDLAKVQDLLAQNPDLLNVQYDWGGGDLETGIQAGAHMGRRDITEFFLEQGAPMIICAAAMLGRKDEVRALLDANAADANARGGHGIPVMFHAAMSGKVEIVELLKARGCNEGYNGALHGAIMFGQRDMVAWLLSNGVTNVDAPNFQGKTPLAVAEEQGLTEIADLLKNEGAKA